MKKLIVTALSAFMAITLAGCTGAEKKAEAIQAIKEAAQNNYSLMNAKFENTTEISVGGKGIFLQSSGAFLQNGKGGYDWYYVNYDTGTDRIPKRETVEVDGAQMVRVILSPSDITEWAPIEKPAISLEDLLSDLFEPDIPEDHIDKVTITESSVGNIYRVAVDESYMEQDNAETIAQFEKIIKELKELDREAALVESYEEQIAKLEATEYGDYVRLFEVNEQGFLKSVTITGTAKVDDETHTTIQTYRLTDLDTEDTEGWIPETE